MQMQMQEPMEWNVIRKVSVLMNTISVISFHWRKYAGTDD